MRPPEWPSDLQFHRCSGRCDSRADRDREDSRRTVPAARLFLRPPYPLDENQRPPAPPAAPRSPRLRPFATLPSTCAREIVPPLPGDRGSAHDRPPGQVLRDACAPSWPPPPRTVRPEESSAGPGPRRGPIPRSSWPGLRVEPEQGTDIPRDQEA